MNLSVKNLLSICWTFFFFTNLYAQAAKPIICDQTYALCTSARCIPLPENPKEAICECVVEKGPSVGFTTCKHRKPDSTKYKTLSLISTFSFEQFNSKKSMSCAKGMPWANCVDMPCTVDPQNKKRALCQCKISSKEAFFTFGGNCKTNTCSTGFWSGATLESSQVIRKALLKSSSFKGDIKPEVCDKKD